jgi:5-methylcytosine-specific restriction endonuclease McrA
MSSNLLIGKSETFRSCFRDSIPEIADAARYLDAAVSAHLIGRSDLANELIRLADMPVIREWTESLWGSKSPYVKHRVVSDAPPSLLSEQRAKERMPTLAERSVLYRRDGYHCRFCGIPVIRKEVRDRIRKVYPDALPWGSKNVDQHAAFQAMWAQYDHLLPHARGGNNDLENIVITCAPCNFGRMNSTLEEVGLIDPRTREPVRSTWDGLERFR